MNQTRNLAAHPQGHLMLSTDALETFLDAGDAGLEDPERIFNMGTSFNTGATWGRPRMAPLLNSNLPDPDLALS